MSKKILGIEFEKNQKVTILNVGQEVTDYLLPKNAKDHSYYIKKFIGGQKNFDIVNKAFQVSMKKAIPDNLKDECLWCQGKSKDEADKKCNLYYWQMEATYMMAATEFVLLVRHNKNVLRDPVYIQQLTIEFFNSFHFIKNRGVVYIDLDLILRHTLNAGFLSLSKMFSQSKTLNNLKFINKSLDEIDLRELQNDTLQKEDEDYLHLQRKFFETKNRFYEKALLIEKEELGNKSEFGTKQASSKSLKISIPKYALYYYYLQLTGNYPYFENHPNGKVAGIKDIIEKEAINTTYKHFQLKYNFIANHATNRIAKNQESNISFVANNMLENYPKAKELALSELKQAATKNR